MTLNIRVNSVVSCNSSLAVSNLPPPQSSLFRRRSLIFPPVSFRAPPPQLFTSVMQSPTIQSPADSAQEHTSQNKLNSGDNRASADGDHSTNSSDFNLFQFFSLQDIPLWAKVALGAGALLAIPLGRKFFKIKGMATNAEKLVEAVEKAAEVVEEVAEEAAEVLPDGSMLKEGALKLQKLALLIDKDAELADSFIHKVDDAVHELDTKWKPLVKEEVKKEGEEEKIRSKKDPSNDEKNIAN